MMRGELLELDIYIQVLDHLYKMNKDYGIFIFMFERI